MTKLLEQEYENFIKQNKMCDFEQSLIWNKIKSNWQNQQIIITEENQIVLTANLLIRKIPFFGNLIYIPRGPIGDIHNMKAMKKLTNELKVIAKKYKSFAVLIEPDININDEKFKLIVKHLGYKINSKSQNFKDSIQSRYNLRLLLKDKSEDELLATFNQKTRYNINLATKKGIKVEESKDLDTFYNILKETSIRDNFIIRPKEYYANIMRNFKGSTILLASYNNEPIAGIMPLNYGNKTWYLYGASSNKYRNLMPNYLLQWEAIKRAKKQNSIIYDFKGCSFQHGVADGLYRFKKGFGSDLVELIGEVSLEIKPLKYHLFKISKSIYVRLRKIKFSLKNKNNH